MTLRNHSIWLCFLLLLLVTCLTKEDHFNFHFPVAYDAIVKLCSKDPNVDDESLV